MTGEEPWTCSWSECRSTQGVMYEAMHIHEQHLERLNAFAGLSGPLKMLLQGAREDFGSSRCTANMLGEQHPDRGRASLRKA